MNHRAARDPRAAPRWVCACCHLMYAHLDATNGKVALPIQPVFDDLFREQCHTDILDLGFPTLLRPSFRTILTEIRDMRHFLRILEQHGPIHLLLTDVMMPSDPRRSPMKSRLSASVKVAMAQ